MPSVVTFWQLPDEEEALLEALDKTGEVIAYQDAWTRDPALLASGPLRAFLEEHDPDDVRIGPGALRPEPISTVSKLSGETLYGYSWHTMPLVAYTRPRFRSPGALGQSNLCADWWQYIPEIQESLRKPEAFIRWAQRVFRWVRRATPTWHEYRGYRVTDRVAAAIAGGLSIVP